jgi:uncharacterized protein (TIGR00251 family)
VIRNGWTAREKDGAVELVVYVQPRSRTTEIAGRHGGILKLKIAAPPVDNAANAAVVSFFASYFSLAKSRVKIVAGERSREKTVRIQGLALSEASRLLE